MNTIKYIFIFISTILMIGCLKDEGIGDVEFLYDYNEFFNTSGYVTLKEQKYPLSFGSVSLINSTNELTYFNLSLFHVTLNDRDINSKSDLINIPSFINLDMDLCAPNAEYFSEGEYKFTAINQKQSFSISNTEFRLTEEADTLNNYVGTYKIISGALLIKSVNEYPFPGFESIIINTAYEFVLENNDSIAGEYIGRVLR